MVIPPLSARRPDGLHRLAALLVFTAGAALLAGCKTSGAPARDPGSAGPRATPTAPPGPACRPGIEVIGVLRVTSNTVRINGVPASTGQTVCTDDAVSTDARGEGEIVLVSGGDSVQLAENTDPRFRWTAARCLSVYGFEFGTVNLKSNRHCMVLRTRDVLLYQARGSQVQYEVQLAGRNSRTSVKPYQGVAPLKLTPTVADKINTLQTDQDLRALAVPSVNLQVNQLYIYRDNVLAVPPRPLSPRDIRSISVRPALAPQVAPQVTPSAPSTRTATQSWSGDLRLQPSTGVTPSATVGTSTTSTVTPSPLRINPSILYQVPR
jgi:hypothetical protein